MRRLLLIIAAVLLAVVLVFVNHSIQTAAPPEHDESEAQTSQTPPAPAAGAPETELLPEETVGAAGAKFKITVGWYYDETNQPNLKPLQDALTAVKGMVEVSRGHASVVVVDIDLPMEDRTPAARAVTEPGVSINGVSRPELAGNPGEGALTADKIRMLLQKAVAENSNAR